MIDLEFLEALVRLLDESSLDRLEIDREGTRIRLAKSPKGIGAGVAVPVPSALPAAAPPPPAEDAADPAARVEAAAGPASAEMPSANLVDVTSPMVGTFYRAPSPEAPPYVEMGAAVAAGDVLCVIEAMKLMNELECEVSGRIVEICADNAEPVDYGQLLFRVDPA
ncbi:MAG: acetyl-CoA carboxylase biotin carboxyl carrier protein [Gemmatimonadetes bacterium]|nr:acetyl-CoA carboxylase biotin carboxyl carrier protein [Gemmatimonadota bacterium]MDE2677055.1 acetyl-CoA carboxylase biotin carboxyl carrier protein [Gemmatimonadota bacterium]MXX33737.1 acetyl-CoA carboxylase biotin carboxyl carrier protein [Gemmatimonadota bacterium]MYA13016.1 acetyl-CoA carboxylase biotin carboxyl carrier protein [Gemmatimonadota bacterium]MYD14281.1 acetyl-CoA carboxylase biotin carboxyl carrier protein [Gemmatimonadota bacterium]